MLMCGLVGWEIMTLKKAGGFTLRDSNVYNPERNPPTEPVSTTVITAIEKKNVAVQQEPNQVASMATYKYLLIVRWLADICRTFCIHHSNGHHLPFYTFVKGMTKMLLELIDKYRQEFPLEKLFKYSTSFKMKGMSNDSAHFYGYVDQTSLVLTKGKLRLDTFDMEGILECEGMNHSLSQIVLIFA